MSKAFVIPTDISSVGDAETMVRRTVEHFGCIDVLVNNAAINRAVSSDQLRAEDVHASMEANFIGPMAATREAVRVMREQGHGHIINVSAAGYLLGMPLMAPYGASKAAFSSWTRALQAEWAGSEVTVTEFFMGYVQSSSQPQPGEEDAAGVLSKGLAQNPWAGVLFRAQTPEEIARRIVECVRNPRASVYSSKSARLIAFLGLFARLRVPLSASVARTLRFSSGSPVFPSSSTPAAQGQSAAPAKPTPMVTSTAPAALKPVAAEPAKQEVKPVAATPLADRPSPTTAPSPSSAPGVSATAEPAAKKPAAKKKAAKRTAKKTAAKRPAAKKTTKRAAKKVAALSPEATARVRAAAQRAADSAKGNAPSEEKPAAKDSAADAAGDQSKEPSGS